MKRILYLSIAMIFVLSFFTAASGMPKGVPFVSITKNDQSFFEYNSKSNLLLNEEVDRIQTLFRKLGESLNAHVTLNESNKSIDVIKPNVQMITALGIGRVEGNYVFEGVFGKAKRGEKLKFKVYNEIENLPAGKNDFRLLIDTPDLSGYATEEFTVSPEIASTDKTDATITFDVGNAHFSKTGAYNIKLQMKLENEDVFFTIAEKKIDVSR